MLEMNRHNRAISSVFMDFSVRKVGLKECGRSSGIRNTIPPDPGPGPAESAPTNGQNGCATARITEKKLIKTAESRLGFNALEPTA